MFSNDEAAGYTCRFFLNFSLLYLSNSGQYKTEDVMSKSAKEMTDCITALTTLVEALHKFMDSYPSLRDQLLPATLRLSEALPCVSSFLSVDIGELNRRLTEVERRLSLLESDVAELKNYVVQLRADVAQLKADVAQLTADMTGIRENIAAIKKWIETADRIYATKDDLHKLTWRLYAGMGTFAAGIYFIARYVH